MDEIGHKNKEKRREAYRRKEMAKRFGVFILIGGALAWVFHSPATNPSKPGFTIPDMKTAREYYDTGVQYKAAGWAEHSRECLKRAIEMDKSGEIGTMAERFLRTRIPAKMVPMDAEQENIEAFNYAANGDNRKAKQIWMHMINKYPDFEWPYGNLAATYLDEGDSFTAETVAEQAVTKNPHYLNGLLALASAKIKNKDYAGAEKVIAQAVSEDPGDSEVALMHRQILKLKK